MFGWGELGIIIILAIVLLGPEKLPEVARTLGRLYAEYNQAKKRFELELLQGAEFPQKDFLEKMSMKKMDLIKEEITSNIGQLENYLNPVKEVGEKKEVKGEEASEKAGADKK